MRQKNDNFEGMNFRYLTVDAWAERFQLLGKKRKLLTDAMCTQLSLCKDDEARRILLGVSA